MLGLTRWLGQPSRPRPSRRTGRLGLQCLESRDVPAAILGVSSPDAAATYGVGDTLSIQVTFDGAVDVTGTPQLTLETGATDRVLDYTSGSGTDTLTFSYTVQSGEVSADLDYAGTGALSANGGTIEDAALLSADLTLPSPGAAGSLAATEALVIDGVYPDATVTAPANGTYGLGQHLDFTVDFTEPVTVTGTPQLWMFIGPAMTSAYASYESGSGTTSLVFRYTVQAGDLDTDGLGMAPGFSFNGGAIRDAAGNDANANFTAPNLSGVLVDGVVPTITGVTGPGNGTSTVNQTVDFVVDFDEAVTVTGAPRIGLTVGAATVYANYVSGTGTTSLLFRYVVQAGDTDADGIAVASAVDLNGGTIRDAGGNDATLTFTPPNTTGVLVDGIVPAVGSIVRAAANPTNAASVDFTVTFSEAVTGVTAGDFTLTEASGSFTGASVTGVSGSGTTWTVTVATGTGTGTLRLDLNASGTGITDAAGNPIAGGFTAGESFTVDTVAPTIFGVTGPTNGTYTAGQALDFTVTFTEAVTRVGTPRLALTVGGQTVYADYHSAVGQNALVFRYTVQAGDLDTDGIAVASPVGLNGGSITDILGNAAGLTFTPPNTAGVLVDTSIPGVTAVAPPADSRYTVGDHLDFTLTFSEPVTVTGTPRVGLTVGGQVVHAEYLSGSGTAALVFRYTVQPGDTDADGVALDTLVDLNGGTILDASLNAASLVVPAAATPLVTVDTTAPTAVVTLAAGQSATTDQTTVSFTVTFSEPVAAFDASQVVVGGTAGGTVSGVAAAGGTSYTVTVSGLTAGGSVHVSVPAGAVLDLAGNLSTTAFTSPDVQYTPAAVAAPPVTFSVSLPSGSPSGTTVRVFDPTTGQNSKEVVPFAGFGGPVSVASGDTDGDGTLDTVVGAGLGGQSRVVTFDGKTGDMTRSFYAFDTGFRGGVSVAAGDVNGDGVADIIASAGAGGGPHVKVFSGADGSLLHSFYAYDVGFQGGMSVAVGDVNGDGLADIVTGTLSGTPHVKVFSGADGSLLHSFYAFDTGFRGGVDVAVGDVDGDGFADLFAGAGPGGAPQVSVFDGKTGSRRGSFLAFDAGFAGGVSVGVSDADGDQKADIVVGAGPGGGPHVKVFDGETFAPLYSGLAGDAGDLGGVNVG